MKLDDSELKRTIVSDVCSFCKHWNMFEKSCKAFEDIPDEIWSGKNDHTKPYKGDNGIQFETEDE